MVKKEEITKADLLETENRINKEQQEARHWQNSSIQLALSKADENKTENKLLKQSLWTMNTEIKETKDEIKEFKKESKENFNEIKEILKSLENKFVSKIEFDAHVKDYASSKKMIYGGAWFVILWILSYIWNTLWQIIINYKW